MPIYTRSGASFLLFPWIPDLVKGTRIAIVCLLLILADLFQARGDSGIGSDLFIQVIDTPLPVKSNGKTWISYELQLMNFRPSSLRVLRLDILSGESTGTKLGSFAETELTSRLKRPGVRQDAGNKDILEGGSGAIIFCDISVGSSAVPIRLKHRVVFQSMQQIGSGEEVLEGVPVVVGQKRPLVIPSPLRGAGWVVLNGLGGKSHHRQSMLAAYGNAFIPQRYAIDWIKLGQDGKAFHGNSKSNTNWYGYGADVLSVADGTVTQVRNAMPDNVPLDTKPSLSLEDATGNCVILRVERETFAVYGHLQPGSVRVRVGQSVKRGQVLGLLGNSGSSDGPHLHFHLIDRNSALHGAGLPYVFRSFTLEGTAKSFEEILEDGFKKTVGKADRRKKELPMDFAVVDFP